MRGKYHMRNTSRGWSIAAVALVLLVTVDRGFAQTTVVEHAPVVGAKHMYVYLADFADAQVGCTLDEVETVATQVASSYTTYSFGQLTMTAQMLTNPDAPDGHFHIDHPCSD